MFPDPHRTSALPTCSAKTSTLIRCRHKASMEKLVERWGRGQNPTLTSYNASFNGRGKTVKMNGLAYTDGRLVALSTGRAHVAPQRRLLMATVNHEIMALGLAHDRRVDCLVQELVVFRGAQRTSQVSGIILTKTHVKSSSAREPNAIA